MAGKKDEMFAASPFVVPIADFLGEIVSVLDCVQI